jgi:subtilisin family serine protease
MLIHPRSLVAAVGVALMGLSPHAAIAQPRPESTLPTAETRMGLEILGRAAAEPSIGGAEALDPSASVRDLRVTTDDLPPEAPMRAATAAGGGAVDVPFVVEGTLVLQFVPDADPAAITEFLDERNLTVIETLPNLGVVRVQGDFAEYFAPEVTDSGLNDATFRGIARLIEDYREDPLIRAVTPDTFLHDNGAPPVEEADAAPGDAAPDVTANLLTPHRVTLSTPSDGDIDDWGIGDIEADQLWTMDGATDGAIVGVMDVGFNRHEDVTFIGFPTINDPDDHGNHVAAILCARHDNGRGVRGVLPRCMVRARIGDVYFRSRFGGPVTQFMTLFSQILSSLDRFVDGHEDIKTFNVSLGYNWRSNFGINPDDASSELWRILVENQGLILVSVLEAADAEGKVIFSAAGNDSSGLATPINAKFASPFNWAAITAREENRVSNGVVVEAHDRNGNRAGFSNVGGHISCPGVDIFSAAAFGPGGTLAPNAYAEMSGTSMASPYCAGGFQLLQLVRPGYTSGQLVDCMIASNAMSSSGTPMLKLTQAVEKCPAL